MERVFKRYQGKVGRPSIKIGNIKAKVYAGRRGDNDTF